MQKSESEDCRSQENEEDPFDTRKNLYQAFKLPHFKYCADTWHFCSKHSTSKLQKLNERASRFMYSDKQTKYETLAKNQVLIHYIIRELRNCYIQYIEQ